MGTFVRVFSPKSFILLTDFFFLLNHHTQYFLQTLILSFYSTGPFTIFPSQDQEFYVVQKRRTTHFGDPKLWKDWSGKVMSRILKLLNQVIYTKQSNIFFYWLSPICFDMCIEYIKECVNFISGYEIYFLLVKCKNSYMGSQIYSNFIQLCSFCFRIFAKSIHGRKNATKFSKR